MARKRTIPLPDGSTAEAEVLPFRSNVEHWNEYLVDDGTVLKMKLVVTEVVRVEGHYDAAGNPAYVVQSTNVVAVDSPENIRKDASS